MKNIDKINGKKFTDSGDKYLSLDEIKDYYLKNFSKNDIINYFYRYDKDENKEENKEENKGEEEEMKKYLDEINDDIKKQDENNEEAQKYIMDLKTTKELKSSLDKISLFSKYVVKI